MVSVKGKYGIETRGVKRNEAGERVFPPEVRDAIAQASLEHPVAEVAADFDLQPQTIYRWRRALGPEKANGADHAEESEMHNGLPLAPEGRRKGSSVGEFYCENVDAAIEILRHLRGTSARVRVVLERKGRS